MTDITWTPVVVTLGQLKPWAANPRTSSKAQARRLLKSWDDFGQVQAIAVGPDFSVYDGHQRLSALLTIHGAGYQVDARKASRELTDDERRRLVLALHAGAVGSWDWDSLSGWDAGLLTSGGFDTELLKDWKRDLTGLTEFIKSEQPATVDAEAQVDRAAELQEKWGTKLGDLWAIGDHRLIVGDCTDAAVVARVMGGEKADFCFTDPPYNVGKDYGEETNDSVSASDYAKWSRVWFAQSREVSPAVAFTPGAVNLWMWAEIERPKWMAIWVKSNQVSRNQAGGFNTYEPVLCYGKIKVDYDTWDIPVKQEDVSHPVPKTVVAWQKILSDLSHGAALVYDPFGGSGTTMLACQNLGRRCRMAEISPNYCAVILQRMADAYPDLVIELVEDGAHEDA